MANKSTVSPAEVAFMVEYYLKENRFTRTASAFRSEASSVLAPLKSVPSGVKRLSEILNDYVVLKQEQINLVHERTRIDRLISGLHETIDIYRSSNVQPGIVSHQSSPSSSCHLNDNILGTSTVKALSDKGDLIPTSSGTSNKKRKNNSRGRSPEVIPKGSCTSLGFHQLEQPKSAHLNAITATEKPAHGVTEGSAQAQSLQPTTPTSTHSSPFSLQSFTSTRTSHTTPFFQDPSGLNTSSAEKSPATPPLEPSCNSPFSLNKNNGSSSTGNAEVQQQYELLTALLPACSPSSSQDASRLKLASSKKMGGGSKCRLFHFSSGVVQSTPEESAKKATFLLDKNETDSGLSEYSVCESDGHDIPLPETQFLDEFFMNLGEVSLSGFVDIGKPYDLSDAAVLQSEYSKNSIIDTSTHIDLQHGFNNLDAHGVQEPSILACLSSPSKSRALNCLSDRTPKEH